MTVAEKLTTIAENQQKVFEAGKQEAYDKFWDTHQSNGKRTAYGYTFYGSGWTDEMFKPKYNIVPEDTNCTLQMFANSSITNIKQSLEDCGVVLDFSKNIKGLDGSFTWAKTLALPVINMSNGTTINMQYAYYCKTIDKIICRADGTNTWNWTSCVALESFEIEGLIGRNFNISSASKLTPQTAISIITHLANYAGTDNDGKYTLKFHETVWTNLEAYSAAPDGGTWRDYVCNLGWNV